MNEEDRWLEGYKAALEQVESLKLLVDPSVDYIFEQHKQIIVSMLKSSYERIKNFE